MTPVISLLVVPSFLGVFRCFSVSGASLEQSKNDFKLISANEAMTWLEFLLALQAEGHRFDPGHVHGTHRLINLRCHFIHPFLRVRYHRYNQSHPVNRIHTQHAPPHQVIAATPREGASRVPTWSAASASYFEAQAVEEQVHYFAGI
jgi:hypothetical protein